MLNRKRGCSPSSLSLETNTNMHGCSASLCYRTWGDLDGSFPDNFDISHYVRDWYESLCRGFDSRCDIDTFSTLRDRV